MRTLSFAKLGAPPGHQAGVGPATRGWRAGWRCENAPFGRLDAAYAVSCSAIGVAKWLVGSRYPQRFGNVELQRTSAAIPQAHLPV